MNERAHTNRAETQPEHPDPRLRGRTYGVPYEDVWQSALSVAYSRRGWDVVRVDDLKGVLRIEATTLVLRFVDDVTVRISLDENAQTRVDITSASRKGKMDFGTNARRIRRFLRDLDRAVAKLSERRQTEGEPWETTGGPEA